MNGSNQGTSTTSHLSLRSEESCSKGSQNLESSLKATPKLSLGAFWTESSISMTTILYTGQYERLTLQTGFSLTVSRDLKPENILFRTKDMKSDIVIADFGM